MTITQNIDRNEVSFAWQPFAKLNLLRNPFGELVREERIPAAVVDVAAIEPLLNRPRVALQFYGDCGRGKTTHLLALLDHLQNMFTCQKTKGVRRFPLQPPEQL